MTPGKGRWRLARFVEELDSWTERAGLRELDVTLIVLPWIQSRMDDPYRGVRREPEIENLWWGPIPDALGPGKQILCCSYFIVEARDLVQCNSYALLSSPL